MLNFIKILIYFILFFSKIYAQTYPFGWYDKLNLKYLDLDFHTCIKINFTKDLWEAPILHNNDLVSIYNHHYSLYFLYNEDEKGSFKFQNNVWYFNSSIYGIRVTSAQDLIENITNSSQVEYLKIVIPLDDQVECLLKNFFNVKILSLCPTKDSDLDYLKNFPKLIAVFLNANGISDIALSKLSQMTKLNMLSFYKPEITDATVENIAKIINLKSLDLSHNKITDSQIIVLSSSLKNIQSLNLSYTDITEESVAYFARFTNLKNLDVSSSSITKEIFKYIPNIEQINLEHNLFDKSEGNSGTVIIDSSYLKKVVPNENLSLPSLRYINLNTSDCICNRGDLEALSTWENMSSIVTNVSLHYLKNKQKILALKFSGDRNVAKYLKDLYNIRFLDLQYSKLQEDDFYNLGNMKNIRYLDLSHTEMTDHSIKYLENLAQIQTLNLSHTKVTDQGLESIKNMEKIHKLSIVNALVTGRGLKSLENLSIGIIELGNGFDDDGFQFLSNYDSIYSISFSNPWAIFKEKSQITKKSIAHLSKFKNLRFLDISSTQIKCADLLLLQNIDKLEVLFVDEEISLFEKERLFKKFPNLSFFNGNPLISVSKE